jgi:hypothetical protein
MTISPSERLDSHKPGPKKGVQIIWLNKRGQDRAVTGSIGALMYLVLLHLGDNSIVKADPLTFCAVAFVLGFADKSFMQMLQNVTRVIIKPGSQAS